MDGQIIANKTNLAGAGFIDFSLSETYKDAESILLSLRATAGDLVTIPLRVELFYSPDGKYLDTAPYQIFQLDDAYPGATSQKSVSVIMPLDGYIKGRISNLNGEGMDASGKYANYSNVLLFGAAIKKRLHVDVRIENGQILTTVI
jgi:hypothetical protein